MKKKLLLTFVAIFALTCNSAWAQTTVTDVLTYSSLGLGGGTSYSDFEDKTISSTAVYKGNAASNNNTCIQLRSKTSTSGIVTTTTGGKVKSITVVWNSSSANGRTIDIYGANAAYTAASDLYKDDTKGTKLGSIVNGTSTSLTVEGDYTYLGIRSNDGAVYLTSISIEWEVNEDVVTAPTISGDATFEETNTVTITGAEGTTVYYTLDGTDPTTSSSTGTSPISVNLTATTTVKAVAVKDGKTSNVSEKTFTKVEYTNATIADLVTKTEDQSYVIVTFNNAKVTHVNSKTIFLREGDNAIQLYNTSLGLKLNSVVSGTVKMDYKYYYKIPELADNEFTTATNLTETESTEAAVPTEATIEDLLALKHINDLVVIKNATITSASSKYYYANVGDNKIQLYGKDSVVKGYADDGNSYYITCILNTTYNGVAEVLPVAVSTNDPTSISAIEVENAENAPIYNAAGQRVSKSYKGMVIKNGKKYVQK